MLRFTQLGAGAAEGWERGGLDRRGGLRSSGAQGRPERRAQGCQAVGSGGILPTKASKPDWAKGFHLYPQRGRPVPRWP